MNVKDQFEVVPKRGSLLMDGFLPVTTYKQLAQPEEEKSAEDSSIQNDHGHRDDGVPIFEAQV